MPECKYETEASLVRRVLQWVLLLVAVVVVCSFFFYLMSAKGPWLVDVMSSHPAAMIGLPLAAFVATCLVLLLEIREGSIEFEGLGFKFRGASGPIVLWVLCFLAITLAIKLLWHESAG